MSGQRGNRLARKSAQRRAPHQQGESGCQPIRRCVGRPAHSIQLDERLAPVSVGAIAMHEPPDRHDTVSTATSTIAMRNGQVCGQRLTSCGSGMSIRPASGSPLVGLRVSQCSLPRDHGRRRVPLRSGKVPSRRRSCWAVSSAALSGSTGTPSSCVQAKTPLSRSCDASDDALADAFAPHFEMNLQARRRSRSCWPKPADRFAGDRERAARRRRCGGPSRRPSCASRRRRRRSR